jgi:hypothetical protein
MGLGASIIPGRRGAIEHHDVVDVVDYFPERAGGPVLDDGSRGHLHSGEGMHEGR